MASAAVVFYPHLEGGDGLERRLVTILAADVVGYSRLMGQDEAATLNSLKAHRAELISPKASQYGGRTIKLMGDGELMEFASVVEAVKFAIEIQFAMRARNAGVADDRQIVFRIGINIGDVIIEGDDIYGDGVNIAARLEGLAKSGGICVNRDVYHQVRDKLDVNFEELGEVEVKNIARPVRAFNAVLDDKAAAMVTPVVTPVLAVTEQSKPDRKPYYAMALAACLVLAVAVVWWQPWARQSEPAGNTQSARQLPDKPSLAVLPFDNLSASPEQEYFSDGLADDLITDLSKLSRMHVVSRRASFHCRDKKATPEQIAKELNVRFILEGGIRKEDNRVRLNAKLIDTTTSYHMWAERFDWKLEELFSGQDQLSEQIAKALGVKIANDERERVTRRLTTNLDAYDYYLRGRSYSALYSRPGHAKAREMFLKSIELDPGFAAAYAELAGIYTFDWDAQFGELPNALDLAVEAAQKGVALDPASARAYGWLAWAYMWKRQPEKAIPAGRKAVELDPNFSRARALLAEILNFAGKPEEGLQEFNKAILQDPYHAFWYDYGQGHAYDLLGRQQEAIEAMNKALAVNPDFVPAHRHLAVIYSELNRMDEARAAIAAVLKSSPNYTVSAWRARARYVDPEILQRFVEGLRKAGLPD